MTTPQPVGESQELALLRAATLGEYDVQGEIGRGGMATVYLAHDIALDRKVAIKVMAPDLTRTPEVAERFRREARTAASLSHPSIIPIYAVRHTDTLLFFVMKYVEGRPLDCILRESGTLPVPMVQAILNQVAGALGYAHRRGVVHRDVKPGNILVDDEGWCVVTDFGIAKLAESEGLTTTGTMVGTPAYMSPEQCTSRDVTGASDQYALGCVAYELLTGQVPFPGSAMMSVMYAHVHNPPAPLREKREDCPEEVAAAVMRMLAKDPAERFPTLEAAAAAIGEPHPESVEEARDRLIDLARSGEHRRVMDLMSTPRSPLPRVRTPLPRPAMTPIPLAPTPTVVLREKRSPVGLVAAIVGGAALIAAAVLFAPWRRHAPEAPADTGFVTATGAPAPAGPVAPATATPSPAPPAAVPAAEAKSATAAAPAGKGATPAVATPATASASAAPAAPAAPLPVATVLVESADLGASGGRKNLSGGAALLGAGGGAADVAPAVRTGIERALRRYGQALASGSVTDAVEFYPDLDAARQQELAQGVRFSVRWTVGAITLKGSRATAQLTGTTTVLRAGTAPEARPVDEPVELVRSGDEWRIARTAQ